MPFFLGGTSDVPDVLPVQGSVRSNRFWFSGNLHESVVSPCLELRKPVNWKAAGLWVALVWCSV